MYLRLGVSFLPADRSFLDGFELQKYFENPISEMTISGQPGGHGPPAIDCCSHIRLESLLEIRSG